MIAIDTEFEQLIPALQADELAALRESILAEGCRDALVVWPQDDGSALIVDGHNRYRICTANHIPYETLERDFADRSDALMWIIQNQFARRNLHPLDRVRLASELETMIAQRAKARQQGGQGGVLLLANLPKANSAEEPLTDEDEKSLWANLPKAMQEEEQEPEEEALAAEPKPTPPPPSAPAPASINTRNEAAKLAGVSPRTYAKAKVILNEAPPEIVEAVRNDEMSIHAGYQETKRLRDEQQRGGFTPEQRAELAAYDREVDRQERLCKELINAMGYPLSAHITAEAVEAYMKYGRNETVQESMQRCDDCIAALQQLKSLFSQKLSLRRV